MIAAIYARKSSDNEANVSRQVELARDFATAQGWTAPAEHVYTDNDVSGAIFRRPGLDALLRALASTPRPVDVLVVMDASRLGRDMAETLPLQLRIIATGCHIFHYQDGEELKLDTPVQKLVASVANFSHEDYRHQITLKTTAALRKKFAQGHVVGGRVYGYDNVEVRAPAGQRLHVVRQVNDVQAAVVRRIFALCAEGQGFTRIAKALNEDSVTPPRRSSGWAPTAVREILLRPLYRGEVVWNRQRKRCGVKRNLARPEAEWLRLDAPDLRVVPEALWQAAQRRLTRTREVYAGIGSRAPLDRGATPRAWRPQRAEYLLSGIAKCAECGGLPRGLHP